MGTFQDFVKSKGISAEELVTVSKRIEKHDAAARALLLKRMHTRSVKGAPGKTYAELEIGKPENSGRGVTRKHIDAAVADHAITRKNRSKILRAVNALLKKKGESAVASDALFEGTKPRTGKKAEKADKKK